MKKLVSLALVGLVVLLMATGGMVGNQTADGKLPPRTNPTGTIPVTDLV